MSAVGRTLRSEWRASPSRHWLQWGVALTAGVFLIVSVLVQLGAFSWLDQLGVDHLMPGLEPGSPSSHDAAGIWRPFKLDSAWWVIVLNLMSYPCSVLISAAVVALAFIVEMRRGRLFAAVAPAIAWIVGTGIEVVGKSIISRPSLYGSAHGERLHVSSFDAAYPSGHMTRGVIVAAILIMLWPRLELLVLGWVLLVGPSLVLQSAHTPLDVVGGALLGTSVALVYVAVATSDRATIVPRWVRWPRT